MSAGDSVLRFLSYQHEEEHMGRHIADHRGASSQRTQRFAEVERSQGPEGSHPATKAVIARPKDRDDARRVQEFLRIERGEEA